MSTYIANHITISINSPAYEVYEFVSNPRNLPQWAAGLGSSIRQVGEEWMADAPLGAVTVKFAPTNTFGILDHDVTLPSGVTVYNPMRVFPNHKGCEVVFTLYRLPLVSDEAFRADKRAVEQDLRTLKAILEA